MEKPDKTNKLNDINACINRMWTLFSVVAKTEHEKETTAYLEEKERASNLLVELRGGTHDKRRTREQEGKCTHL